MPPRVKSTRMERERHTRRSRHRNASYKSSNRGRVGAEGRRTPPTPRARERNTQHQQTHKSAGNKYKAQAQAHPPSQGVAEDEQHQPALQVSGLRDLGLGFGFGFGDEQGQTGGGGHCQQRPELSWICANAWCRRCRAGGGIAGS